MRPVPFTQYLRPNGRRTAVSIDMPNEIARQAAAIIAAGYRFECEELTTGQVSLTIADDDMDYAIEVVMNGPGVPEAVARLIGRFNELR